MERFQTQKDYEQLAIAGDQGMITPEVKYNPGYNFQTVNKQINKFI